MTRGRKGQEKEGMMAPPMRRLAPLCLVILIAAACGNATGPGTSEAPEKTIYFGTGTTQAEVYLLPVLTIGRKILAEQGISLEYAALSNDEVVAAAVDRGRVDVALISLLGLERAVKAGLRMKWTLTNETQNTFVLTVNKDVTDLSQLRGKRIGLQDPTSLSSIVLPGLMQAGGLGPTDYEVVYLAGSGARAAALTAGSLDATILFRQVAVNLASESDGQFVIWGGGAATLEPMMWEGFVMSDAFRQNKDLANAFIKAALQSYDQFYAGEPQSLADASLAEERPETAGLDPAETAADFEAYQAMNLFPTDGGLDQALFDRMNVLLVEGAQLTEDELLEYADVVDASFVDAAKP
jgi:ABC-type nitrate/sulfonate/bicarbonate transport system substrate-binding protein